MAKQSQETVDWEAQLVRNRQSTSVLGVAKLATSRQIALTKRQDHVQQQQHIYKRRGHGDDR